MLPNALNFVHGRVSNNLQNNGTKNDKSTTNSGENEIEVRRGTLSTLEASKAATIDITDTKTKNMNLLMDISPVNDEDDPERIEIIQPFEINYNVLLQIMMAIQERRISNRNSEELLSDLPKQVTMYKEKPLDILLSISPLGLKAYWGLQMTEVDEPPFTLKGWGQWEVRQFVAGSSTKIRVTSLPPRAVNFVAKDTPRSDNHNLLNTESVIVSWEDLFKNYSELLELIRLQRNIETIDERFSITLEVSMVINPQFTISRKDVVKGYNSKRQTGMVGLENLGATCYLNALLQMLYHINYFRQAVYHIPNESAACVDTTGVGRTTRGASVVSVTSALQTVFHSLQLEEETVTTKELTKAFGWTSAQAYMQQDVQEMMVKLLEKLGDRMVGTPVEGIVDKLFYGKERSYIRCLNVDMESVRDEDMNLITLDVTGCKNVYDSLKKYVAPDRLEGENQYDAGPHHGKQDAEKGAEFIKFPPVLTIQLKRFEFDMQRMSFAKVHDYYEFPERLDMASFVAEDRKDYNDGDGSGTKKQDKDRKNDDKDEQGNAYLLHSVMVHQGEVGGGHYYVYIRTNNPYGDNDATHGEADGEHGERKNVKEVRGLDGKLGAWHRFDDERVLKVSKREAINYNFGRSNMNTGSASAYMLLYIKESHVKHMMQSVPAASISAEARDSIEATKRLRAEEESKMNKTELYGVYNYFDWRCGSLSIGLVAITSLSVPKASKQCVCSRMALASSVYFSLS